MMTRRVVIHLMSPIHAVASMAAIALREASGCEMICIVHQPGLPTESQVEVTQVIGSMLAPFPCKLISFDGMQWRGVCDDGIGALKETIGLGEADAIYYAHDAVGDVLDVLVKAYPRAMRICFGDAMGQVFERHVHLSYIFDGRPPDWRSSISSFFGLQGREEWRKPRPFPDEAILILPVDQSGKFLKSVPYRVCPRATVLEVLERMVGSCIDLCAYQNWLIEIGHTEGTAVLLTENFAEGDFITLEAEVDLYSSVVREIMPPGATVLVKPHPSEILPRTEALQDALSGYAVVRGVEPRFRRYPIELWRYLLPRRSVIAMQYPALSLKYLYDLDVVQPMDNSMIERWFPRHLWASYKNSLALNMVARSRLEGWDGHSALYSGHKDGVVQ